MNGTAAMSSPQPFDDFVNLTGMTNNVANKGLSCDDTADNQLRGRDEDLVNSNNIDNQCSPLIAFEEKTAMKDSMTSAGNFKLYL